MHRAPPAAGSWQTSQAERRRPVSSNALLDGAQRQAPIGRFTGALSEFGGRRTNAGGDPGRAPNSRVARYSPRKPEGDGREQAVSGKEFLVLGAPPRQAPPNGPALSCRPPVSVPRNDRRLPGESTPDPGGRPAGNPRTPSGGEIGRAHV